MKCLISEVWFSNWLGSYCYLCCAFWSCVFVERNKSYSIEREGNYKLEGSSNFVILFLWNYSRYGWRFARSRRRLHFGSTLSRNGNSSSGTKQTLTRWHRRLVSIFHICKLVLNFLKFWSVFSLLQVASATSTFSMLFSSSMSVVQYYYLDRFPVPYGKYFASYLFLIWHQQLRN